MTREEWLRRFAREQLHSHLEQVIPSFPSSRARNGRLGDIARDQHGRPVLMVSPLIANSVEVGVVAAYLVDRFNSAQTARRLGERSKRAMRLAGWRMHDDNSWAVDPSDWLADGLAAKVAAHVEQHGEYPAAPVASTRQQRHSRSGVLTLTCEQHSDLRAQQTPRQFESNPVLCGQCQEPLVEVRR